MGGNLARYATENAYPAPETNLRSALPLRRHSPGISSPPALAVAWIRPVTGELALA